MTLEFIVWFGLTLMGWEEKDSVLVNYELQHWNYKLLPEFTMNLDLLKFLRHCSNPTLIIWIYGSLQPADRKQSVNIIHSYFNIEKYVYPLLQIILGKLFLLVWQLFWTLKSSKYVFKLLTIQNAKFTQDTFLEQEREGYTQVGQKRSLFALFPLISAFLYNPSSLLKQFTWIGW